MAFLPADPHSDLTEELPDIFFVTGTRHWDFMDMHWHFSRNMTVVREGEDLTIFNSVRLNDEGLAKLESLGTVKNLVQVGGLHGVDDPFYKDRYGATYWAQPGAGQAGMTVDAELVAGGELPVSNAELFVFETTNVPETVFLLNRDGGVAIGCDALQNWEEPNAYFSDQSIEVMTGMGFFTPANVGPVWMQAAEPKAEDFVRLRQKSFEHCFTGHGTPIKGGASEKFAATFKRLFDVD